ncbi:MAG: hypothetical protein H0V76_06070 [Blastocatellia bacterium]|nr:hypothetical protein [Blastocatellia bacterium]
MKTTFLLLLSIGAFSASESLAAQPTIWTVNSRADVLRGDARNVSIGPNGSITIAPELVQVFRTDQPFVWSSVIDASGNTYLGTGGNGRIFVVAPNGSGRLLTDLDELNVSALALGRGGELFAATSPDGKVYRVSSSGTAEVYFDPQEKYIWSLAVTGDGSLAVGTGETGKIFRVRSANQTPAAALLFDTSESHIISLAVDSDGRLYAGTDSNGLILRFDSDGRPFALLDSPLREIHKLAVGPDGSVYALALATAVASAEPAPSPTPGGRTVTVDRPTAPQPEQTTRSRYDLTNARAAVYRILPTGGSDLIWSSTSVVGFSLLADPSGGVLLGTSDRGRVYRLGMDGSETLAVQSESGQISSLLRSGQNVFAASSNQGNLYRFANSPAAEGSYESPVLDARTSAQWGRIWWRSAGNVVLETRSGNTENPSESWSSWVPVRAGASSGPIASPPARFLQWRAVLKSSSTPAVLHEVSAAFVGRNIAPEVVSITVLPTNIGLLANPPQQIDPNIELAGLDSILFGIPNQAPPPRRVYQRGAIAFQWTAEDRGGDTLVYDLYIAETGESEFRLLRSDLNENFFTLDGLSFADGRYVIKVVAKDSPSNPAGQFLTGERVSEPFSIDNTQPTVAVVGQPQVIGDRARVVFSASDRSSYLVRAEYSVNGGEWQAVAADDGISDGPNERYTVDVSLPGIGSHSITLRVFDSAGNIGNARAVVRR